MEGLVHTLDCQLSEASYYNLDLPSVYFETLFTDERCISVILGRLKSGRKLHWQSSSIKNVNNQGGECSRSRMVGECGEHVKKWIQFEIAKLGSQIAKSQTSGVQFA